MLADRFGCSQDLHIVRQRCTAIRTCLQMTTRLGSPPLPCPFASVFLLHLSRRAVLVWFYLLHIQPRDIPENNQSRWLFQVDRIVRGRSALFVLRPRPEQGEEQLEMSCSRAGSVISMALKDTLS